MKRYIPRHAGKRKPIPSNRIIVVCILLITAIATLTVGITLAKMVATGGGNSRAQAAAFIVEAAEGTPSDLKIDCNTGATTASYSFAVTNTKNGKTAEVSVKYDLIVTMQEALPESLTMTVGEKEGIASENGLVYTFTDVGVLPAGQVATQSCTLLVTADSNLVEKDFSIDGINIDIHTEQVD